MTYNVSSGTLSLYTTWYLCCTQCTISIINVYIVCPVVCALAIYCPLPPISRNAISLYRYLVEGFQ